MRLDKYLEENYNISRSKAQKYNKDGLVIVNGEHKNNNYKINDNDVIELLEIKEDKPSKFKAQDIELDILYEDDYLLIVNKPSGMVTHPALGNYEDTLLNALLYKYDMDNSDERSGIVHRLDKDTSGLLIVAKDDKTKTLLTEMFKNREIHKRYLALVENNITNKTGTINLPIGRDKRDRKKMAVVRDGKDSITNFKVLEQLNKVSLVDIDLETGRTHQIRVHFSYIGHPVLGDNVYGHKLDEFNQYLHSYHLDFMHPITGKEISIDAPLPQKFLDKIEELK